MAPELAWLICGLVVAVLVGLVMIGAYRAHISIVNRYEKLIDNAREDQEKLLDRIQSRDLQEYSLRRAGEALARQGMPSAFETRTVREEEPSMAATYDDFGG